MVQDLTIDIGPGVGSVSGILQQPSNAWALLVLAHGAGAGMRHPFMSMIADGLAERGMATLRYQFPYMEQGTGRPDRPQVAQATVRAAVAKALELAPQLPLFAGGKSFGGRMTSSAAAESQLKGVRGIVFLGFPLHAPGKPGAERGSHLASVQVPMLFLQGTRDTLADLTLLRGVLKSLGSQATLEVIDGGDHSFKVPKRSGQTPRDVETQILGAIAGFGRIHAQAKG
jgi:predicted alpha/beta-hydrolase family hydrolase